MTLALPKAGLRAPVVAGHVGELYLADISASPGSMGNPRRISPWGRFLRDWCLHQDFGGNAESFGKRPDHGEGERPFPIEHFGNLAFAA
ncbi:MAG: hypothetical protein V3T00_07165, partial [bacterium]